MRINVNLGLPMLLTASFVVLKLVGAITWSWWWVISPAWITFGLGMLLFGAALAFADLKRNR